MSRTHERRWRADQPAPPPLFVEEAAPALMAAPLTAESWDGAAEAVVRLQACRPGEAAPRKAGTGVLIGPDLILTAGHVIFDKSSMAFGMARQGYAGRVIVNAPWTPPQGVAAQRMVAANGWTLNGRPAFDIGLIKLDAPAPITPLAPAALPDAALTGPPVRVYGVTAGSAQLHTGLGVGHPGLGPEVGLVFHTAQAEEGMSGGPLLVVAPGAPPIFAAVHRAGPSETPPAYGLANGAVRLTPAAVAWISSQEFGP